MEYQPCILTKPHLKFTSYRSQFSKLQCWHVDWHRIFPGAFFVCNTGCEMCISSTISGGVTYSTVCLPGRYPYTLNKRGTKRLVSFMYSRYSSPNFSISFFSSRGVRTTKSIKAKRPVTPINQLADSRLKPIKARKVKEYIGWRIHR